MVHGGGQLLDRGPPVGHAEKLPCGSYPGSGKGKHGFPRWNSLKGSSFLVEALPPVLGNDQSVTGSHEDIPLPVEKNAGYVQIL